MPYLFFFFLINNCSTPAQVTQLSVQQTEYFDVAIEAVEIQSEALISATEKIAEDAKKRIDRNAKDNEKRLVNLMTDSISVETAEQISQRLLQTSTSSRNSKDQLD